MLTIDQAKTLRHGQILHHVTATQANGKAPLQVRVNGKIQTWKTSPSEFRIPVKHGLYEYGQITDNNAQFWCIPA